VNVSGANRVAVEESPPIATSVAYSAVPLTGDPEIIAAAGQRQIEDLR
jgi:hypothetical protein